MDETAPTWAELVEGWQLGIYDAPILCGVVAGAVLGYLGVFIVVRRMVFITAAVSQASGLGVALSFYAAIHLGIEVHPVLGALLLALLTAGVLAIPPARLRLSSESILGLAYLVCWAGAVLTGDRISQEAHDIAAILFGTAVLVRPEDLVLVVAVGGAVLLLYLVLHRGLVYAAFDADSARVQGIPVRALDLAGWLLTALVVAVSTRALGVLPVFAFAVLPAMTALLLSDRLRWVLLLAALLGGVAGGAGYLAAFFFSLPVGACQAAVAVALFVLALPARFVRRSPARAALRSPP